MNPPQVALELEPRPYQARKRRPLPYEGRSRAQAVRREAPVPSTEQDGEKLLPWRQLARALGPSTWRLWTALLTLRNDSGETHATTEKFAEVAQLSERGVKKALVRLRAVKLVDDLGWMWRHVPCACPAEQGGHLHEVYVRRVFGGVPRRDKAACDEPVVQVPASVEKWTLTAPGCGGRRAGAGRPEGSRDKAPRGSKTLSIRGDSRQSEGSAYKNQKEEEPERTAKAVLSGSSSPRGARQGKPAKSGSRMTPIQRAVGEAIGAVPRLRVVQASPAEVTDEAALGMEQAGGRMDFKAMIARANKVPASRQRLTVEDFAAMPLLTAMPCAHVPAPPQVPADDEGALRVLARAYSTAHEKVYGRRPYRSGLVRRMAPRNWLPAAQALRERGISPVTWAAFMMSEVWRKKLGKKGAPTPGFVWDELKVPRWERWCTTTLGTLATGTPIYGPAAREYGRLRDELRNALGWGKPPAEVVAAVFPVELQTSLMAQVVIEAEEARQELQRLVDEGAWLWRGLP